MSNSKNFIFENETPWESVGDGVRRQVIGYDDQMMMVKVEFQTGAIGNVHTHSHRQCTYVVSGVFEFKIGEKIQLVKTGDGLYMEPDVPHGVVCVDTGVLIDTFSPMRREFL